MSTHRKHYLPVKSGSATHIKVEVYYSKGGMNYFTGSNERRGIYLSVSPVSRTVYEGGGASEGYTAFTGVKQFLLEMNRFSQKTLDNFVYDEEVYKTLLNKVLTTNNIVLI